MLLNIIVLHFSLFTTGNFTVGENDYWIRQGDRAYNQQNIEESIIHYTRAIDERPKNPIGYIKRARSYRASGYLLKSAEDMRKAIELDPQFTKSYLEVSRNRATPPN